MLTGLPICLAGLTTCFNCQTGLAKHTIAGVRTSQSPAKRKRIKKYPFPLLRTKAYPIWQNRINLPYLQDYNTYEKSN
jgi:hypothetical protein